MADPLVESVDALMRLYESGRDDEDARAEFERQLAFGACFVPAGEAEPLAHRDT